jgi:excisionase family DNA binding protein
MTAQKPMTPADVAELLNVSTGLVYKLVAAGEFPNTERFAGVLRISVEDLAAYRQRSRLNATS